MAPRTTIFKNPTVVLPSGGTMIFPIPPSPDSKTICSFPRGSKFDSELHWHENYTEYFRVASGVMRVVLEDAEGALQTCYVGKNSGIVEIPRGRRHRLRRGDSGGEWESWMASAEWREGGKVPQEVWESELRGEEWTSPQDGRKEMFFRNLAGVVDEARSGKGRIKGFLERLWVVLGVFVVMREFDNWPAFLGGRLRGLEWLISHFVLWVAKWIGWCVGLTGVYEEYTPVELRRVEGAGKGKKDWRKEL